MEFLTDLWLPILLSAVFVFVASSVVHMVLPTHKSDYSPLPNEAAVLDGLRSHNLPPGEYVFPHCDSMKALGTEEMQNKFKTGPVGHMTLLPPGPMAMGKSLVQWFIYSIVISIFCAYLTSHAAAPGADYMRVFRLSGTIAVLAYGLAHVPNSIWKGASWTTSAKFFFDGLIYGLVTAGTFAWLWPDAV